MMRYLSMGKILAAVLKKLMPLILISFFFIIYYSNTQVRSDIFKSQTTIRSLGMSVKVLAENSYINLKETSDATSHTAKFNSAVAFVLRHEGGLVDDKSDRGGITKYGISYRYLRGLDARVVPSTIKNLTLQQAKDIYHTQWWDKYHFGSLNNQAIATKAFDYSVNMGKGPAIKLLQIASNQVGGTGTTVNGELDNQTINHINSLNNTQSHQLLYAYENVVSNHYIQIAKAIPNDKKFLHGWLLRSNDNNFSTTVV